MNDSQILNQEEIDALMGFRDAGALPPPQIPVGLPGNPGQFVQTAEKSSPGRVLYYTYPITYCGSKCPDYWGVRTVYERWDERTRTWQYVCHGEKMYHPNGRPVGGY